MLKGLGSKLPQLIELNVSGNKDVSSDGLAFLQHCRNLKILDLSSCIAVKNDTLEYVTSNELRTLRLSSTTINDEGLADLLKANTKLRTLDLSSTLTLFDPEVMIAIGNLGNLKILEVGYTNLDDAGLALIGRQLLVHDPLRKEGPFDFQYHGVLEKLDISSTRVTDNGIVGRKEFLPYAYEMPLLPKVVPRETGVHGKQSDPSRANAP